MKLTFLERMMILNLLPETGTFVSLKVIRVLREALVPTADEVKELSVVENTETGQVTWDSTKDFPKEVEVGEIASGIIEKKLKEMDKAEELTLNHESIYKIFVD